MRVHHLNCGTLCPAGGRLLDGHSPGVLGRLVCHCLLIETHEGLVLVDTGLGMRDVSAAAWRLSPLWMAMLNIQLKPEDTALAQVRAAGFDPGDVRHIVLTHLDFDHAGGLEDFPNATVHLLAAEKRAAEQHEGFVGRRRYRVDQWNAVKSWRTYEPARGERWNGFECVRDLDGLPPEILLVPLTGHTWGHAGVAVRMAEGWLLHAGDAYFHHAEMGGRTRRCPPGLRAYQNLMEVDRAQRLANQERLRHLARFGLERGDLRVFCAHDEVEFRQAQRRERAQARDAIEFGGHTALYEDPHARPEWRPH